MTDSIKMCGRMLLPIAAIWIFSAVPASAAGVNFTVTVQSVMASAGDIGDSFEVDLTNHTTAAQIVNFTLFALATSNPGITLTSASITTLNNPYIFDTTDSFVFSNMQNLVLPTSPFQVSDNWNDPAVSPNGYSLPVGATIGIGEIFFNVAPGLAPGPYTVSILSGDANTQFSDPIGTALSPLVLTNGTITVAAASGTPEPATFVLIGLAALPLVLARKMIKA